MQKYILLLSAFLLFNGLSAQPEVQSSKDSLALSVDEELRKSLLVSITEHYAKSGQVDKDSLRKYSFILLELLKDEPLSVIKAKAKEYRLIADFRLPFVQYAELAKDLISDYKNLGNYAGVIREMYFLANKAHTAGEPSSFMLYREGLDLLKQYQEDLSEDAFCRWNTRFLASTAANYDYVGLYDDAIEMVLTAVAKAESCNDSTSMLYAYVPAGAILGGALENVDLNREKWPDLEKHLVSYLSLTRTLAVALDKHITEALASYNLAYYYFTINDMSSAQAYLHDSWNVEGIEWMTRQVYLNHALEADILIHKGKRNAALVSYKKAFESALKLNEPLSLFDAQKDLAKWYLEENQLMEAQAILDKMDGILINHLENQRDYYLLAYEVALKTNDHESAIDALEAYHIYKDSINSNATSLRITSILAKHDMSIADSKIALLESENSKAKLQFQKKIGILVGFLSLLLVGGFAFFFIVKQRLLRSKQHSQEVQQQLFRAQMNPHFIFNTLGSIQSFLLNNGKAQDAAYFLTKFAKLMRQILSQSQHSFISLQDEVDTLNNYLLLQRMRFEERFNYNIEIAPSINLTDTQVPPMILQPIIENAIEHGKIYTQPAGVVRIGIELVEDLLSVKISDNGIGIDHKKEIPLIKKESSFSIKIIQKRLQFLSKNFNKIASVKLIQPEDGGTMVHVLMPFLNRSSV